MDFIFSTACYIAATILVLWLRSSDSKRQQSDADRSFEQAEAEMEEIEQPQPEQVETEAIADDIWETEIATSAPRFWVRQQPQSSKPVLMLVAAKEEAKPVVPTRTAIKKSQEPLELNLSALDSTALRRLCSQHGIQWRDARGRGKHLTKAAMIFQLEQKATA